MSHISEGEDTEMRRWTWTPLPLSDVIEMLAESPPPVPILAVPVEDARGLRQTVLWIEDDPSDETLDALTAWYEDKP